MRLCTRALAYRTCLANLKPLLTPTHVFEYKLLEIIINISRIKKKKMQYVRKGLFPGPFQVTNRRRLLAKSYSDKPNPLRSIHSAPTFCNCLARPQLRVDELTPPATAMTLQRLGEALALRGEHGRSADAFARAVTANKALFGAVSAQTVDSLTGLGLALLEQV